MNPLSSPSNTQNPDLNFYRRISNKFIFPPADTVGERQWELNVSRRQTVTPSSLMSTQNGRSQKKEEHSKKRSSSAPPMESRADSSHFKFLDKINEAIKQKKPWLVKQELKKNNFGLSHASRAELVAKARKRDSSQKLNRASVDQKTPSLPRRSQSINGRLNTGSLYQYSRFLSTTFHNQSKANLGFDLLANPRTPQPVLLDFFKGFSLETLVTAMKFGQVVVVQSLLKKAGPFFSPKLISFLINKTRQEAKQRIKRDTLNLKTNRQQLASAIKHIHRTNPGTPSPFAVIRAMTTEQMKDIRFVENLLKLGNSPEDYQAMQTAIQKGVGISPNSIIFRIARQADAGSLPQDMAALEKAGVISSQTEVYYRFFETQLLELYRRKADHSEEAKATTDRIIEDIATVLGYLSKKELLESTSQGNTVAGILQAGSHYYPRRLKNLINKKLGIFNTTSL